MALRELLKGAAVPPLGNACPLFELQTSHAMSEHQVPSQGAMANKLGVQWQICPW